MSAEGRILLDASPALVVPVFFTYVSGLERRLGRLLRRASPLAGAAEAAFEARGAKARP